MWSFLILAEIEWQMAENNLYITNIRKFSLFEIDLIWNIANEISF